MGEEGKCGDVHKIRKSLGFASPRSATVFGMFSIMAAASTLPATSVMADAMWFIENMVFLKSLSGSSPLDWKYARWTRKPEVESGSTNEKVSSFECATSSSIVLIGLDCGTAITPR